MLTTENGSDAFIVAGGVSPSGFLKNVEALEGDHWNDEGYADLPKENWLSCIIKINSTTMMAIGGGICIVTLVLVSFQHHSMHNHFRVF